MKKNKVLLVALAALPILFGCSKDIGGESSSSSASSEASSVSSEAGSSSASSDDSSSSSEANSSSSSESLPSSESSSSIDSSSSDTPEPAPSSEARKYDIEVTGAEGITVTGLSDKYEAGSTVSFTLAVTAGFNLVSVKAKAGVSDVTLSVEGNTYSFVMPKRGVSIVIESERLSYKITTSDLGSFIKSITQKKAGSDSYVALESKVEEGEDGEETTYKVAQFGAEIKVELQTSSEYDLKGVSVNGKDIDIEGKSELTFSMPALNTTIATTRSDKPIEVKVNDSDHLSLTIYEDKEGKKEIKGESFIPYTTVYLSVDEKEDIEESDIERYALKKLSYTYLDNYGINKSEEITYKVGDYYEWRVPKYNSLTLVVEEYDTRAYEDYSIVGDYLVVDLSNTGVRDETGFKDKWSFSIDGAGSVTMDRDGNTTERTLSSVSAKTGEGSVSYDNGSGTISNGLLFDDKAIVGDTYLGNPYKSTSYLFAAVKKEKGDEDSIYSAKATQFKIDSHTYAVVTFYRNNTLYESIFIERTGESTTTNSNTITMGVDVDILSGSYVSDEKASFIVSNNSTELIKIGSKGDGGCKNRVLLGDEYGDYSTSDSKTIHLDGVDTATYEGEQYAYSVIDGVVTLSSNTRTIVGTLDITNKTITITKDEESSGLPVWVGYKFRGVSVDGAGSDASASYPFTIAFHSDKLLLDCDQYWYYGSSPYYSTSDIAYEVTNGTTVKTKFYSINWKDGFDVTLTYIAGTDGNIGYFLANGGKNGAYFKDTKFTLVQ